MSKVEMKRLNLSMPKGLLLKLKAAAGIEFKSMNGLILAYIKLGLLYSSGELAIYHVREDGAVPVKVII